MLRALMLAALLVPAPAIADLAEGYGNAARGQVVARVRCMPCHHLEAASRSIGPSLKGIYGQAPSIVGVPFDVWSDAALNLWLADPRAVKPNTRMALPPIAARDRADIIAWFRSQAETE